MESILTTISNLFNFLQKIIYLIQADIEYLRWEAYIVLFFIFFISFLISRYFQAVLFRLICVFVGLGFLSEWTQVAILRDYDFLIGMGLITPHIKYFIDFIINIILSIFRFFYSLYLQFKYATINTYYFFLTVYYKILRLINWLLTPFIFIKNFFTGKRREEKQDYSSSEDYTNSSFKQNNSYSSNRSSEENSYDNEYRHKNSYNYSKSDDYSKQNNSYEEENKSSYTQDESNNYKEDVIENVSDEFKQFYSPSAYVVLGVSASDDNMKTIKKKYFALLHIYHPDKNVDNFELYNELAQKINEAYKKLEKIHG